MKLLNKFLTLTALMALILLPTGAVHAQGPGPDSNGRVIFGSNFTLKSGDTYNGDLVIFGGNVTVENDANLNGDLAIFGGTVDSNGQINGDVAIIGGQVSLGEKAHVTGDVSMLGGQLQQADGALIDGDVVNNSQPDIQIPGFDGRIPPSNVQPTTPTPSVNFDFNPFVDGFWIFFWAVVISAFAMLLSLFWQKQFESAGNLVVTQPFMIGAIGLVATFVGILFALTLLPPVIVAFAWLFGIIAMGSEVGERFTKAINQTWTPILTTGFGTFLLMLIGGAIGQIPCLGWAVVFLLGILGVGGSLVTWFGMKPFQQLGLKPSNPPVDIGQIPPAS